jgi:hypothetical protein
MKTLDAIQTRVQKIGAGVVGRLSTLPSSAAVIRARKAVRRGTEQSVKWVRRNPAALPLAGLGGLLATWLLVRTRRKARANFFHRAMAVAGPQGRKGMRFALGRFLAWALTPRKPLAFRAISIRW